MFGGKSAEHEVSIVSAGNVLKAIDRTKFDPVLIGIDKSGRWHSFSVELLGSGPSENQITEISDSSTNLVTMLPGNNTGELRKWHKDTSIQEEIDVIFPILHGPMGEDGTIQGFLELANVPYIGPGVLGSAICMDKDVMKRLLMQAGIAVAQGITITPQDDINVIQKSSIDKLGLPLFVKPARMGSSIGVSRVDTASDFKNAVQNAFQYDTKVLLERMVVGDEIECAVLGHTNSPRVSEIGRVIPQKDSFYSYEAKYITDEAILEIPAKISKKLSQRAKDVAKATYKTLECEGMSRVDMFIDSSERIIVNEVNTIPGFTNISMYPKLWDISGLEYRDLITELINEAVLRFHQKSRLKTNYDGHI